MLNLFLGLACLGGCAAADAPAPRAVSLPPASRITTEPGSVARTSGAPPVLAEPAPPAPAAVASVAAAGAITFIIIDNTGKAAASGASLTVGQVFAPGDLQPGDGLIGQLPDGSRLPLQMDVKARHADGSVRHALLSVAVPALGAGERRQLDLFKAAPQPAAAPLGPQVLLDKGFSASVSVKLGQQTYQASADALLRRGAYTSWIAGPVASEWLLQAPLTDAGGKPHPHLAARFAIRTAGNARARVDVTLENNWAFEPAPSNLQYDTQITVGGKPAFSKTGLTHYHHARWRKVLWWGEAPELHVRHDTRYLIASRALPNYDQRVQIGETALAALQSNWRGPKTEIMGIGLATAYMPATGGREDIGLLPGWAASYLLSMDRRAKQATLGTADLAGSWSSHYRDRKTGRPVSVRDYPYMTLLGQRSDTYNPATRREEAFPPCASATACTTPYVHDASHQPAFAYLPYLVTGDYYYLEELQFWAMFNTFMSNPGYREHSKGLVKPDQVRGQAWSLRTLGEAAYITPDADPLKAHFNGFMAANLAWYNANYTHNPGATPLGALTHGYAITYDKGTGLAPWMDDFFTSAVGHVAELGFPAARPLLDWKVRFPIARMTASGTCWVNGAIYALKVRDSPSAPLYTSMAQASRASHPASFLKLPCGGAAMASALGLRVGEMTGYSSAPTGYPSNMQPALAYAADVGGVDGGSAWQTFERRSVKPNYSLNPQFAIIPRSTSSSTTPPPPPR